MPNVCIVKRLRPTSAVQGNGKRWFHSSILGRSLPSARKHSVVFSLQINCDSQRSSEFRLTLTSVLADYLHNNGFQSLRRGDGRVRACLVDWPFASFCSSHTKHRNCPREREVKVQQLEARYTKGIDQFLNKLFLDSKIEVYCIYVKWRFDLLVDILSVLYRIQLGVCASM